MSKKICAIATIDQTLEFFVVPAMRVFKEYGHDVTLICSMPDAFINKFATEFHCINLPMQRGISLKDLLTMPWKLYRIFRREQFDLIQYATPNASLYTTIAALLAGVKKRVYCQWGIRYIGSQGLMRIVLKGIERFVCSNATHIRSASRKNMEFAVSEGLYKAEKVAVIGDGGTIGVDLTKFDITKKPVWREKTLDEYPILRGKIVFCFVGRLHPDKGIVELLQAFQRLNTQSSDIALLLVGYIDGINPEWEEYIKVTDCIVHTGLTYEVPQYTSAADILVHPTYREGFSMVIQEAMAMELPVITTDVPGPSEVIEQNVSGLLVKPKDTESLYHAMKTAIGNMNQMRNMGKAGRRRCEEKFARERMIQLTYEDRMSIINS